MKFLFRIDIAIFFLSWIFYGFIGKIFAKNTLLPLHPNYIHDLYLGFDNAYLNTSIVRHPLLKGLAIFLSKILSFATSPAIFLVALCSFLLAIQMVFIFKYLTLIIHLRKKDCFAILLFYFGTSQQLILSFTFESYTFSTCFLSLFLYFHAYYHQIGISLPKKWFYLLLFSISGITITNGLKVLLITYQNNKIALAKHFAIVAGFALIPFFLFLEKVMGSIQHLVQFIKHGNHYLSDLFYLFFGGGILFPELKISTINYEYIQEIKILLASYPEFWSMKTLVITNVLFVLGYSIFKNFNIPLVRSLLILFSIDILLHAVLRLGLNEAQIFSGNFSIIYPLLWAYLLKTNKFYHFFYFNLWFVIISVYILNFTDLFRILEFGKTFYPLNGN